MQDSDCNQTLGKVLLLGSAPPALLGLTSVIGFVTDGELEVVDAKELVRSDTPGRWWRWISNPGHTCGITLCSPDIIARLGLHGGERVTPESGGSWLNCTSVLPWPMARDVPHPQLPSVLYKLLADGIYSTVHNNLTVSRF